MTTTERPIELKINRNIKHGHARRGHQSREYNAWLNAKKRCFRPNNPKYADYGGRGITMCPEWKDSFPAFLRDMGPVPDGYSLHRVDNDGNYEQGNCCWASRKEQDRHKRNNKYLEHGGVRQTQADWAKSLGMSSSELHQKLMHGHALAELIEGQQLPMAA
jgi:hypothetical protein